MADNTKFSSNPDYLPVLTENLKDETFARPLLHIAGELEKLIDTELTPVQRRSLVSLNRLAASLCLAAENIRLCESLPGTGTKSSKIQEFFLAPLLAKHLDCRQDDLIVDLDPGLPPAVSCDAASLELLLENLLFLAGTYPGKVLFSLRPAGFAENTMRLGLLLQPQTMVTPLPEFTHPAFNLALAATGRLLRNLGGSELLLNWPRIISCLLPLQLADLELPAAKTFSVKAALIVCRRPALRLCLSQLLRGLQVRVMVCEDGMAGSLQLQKQQCRQDEISFVFCEWHFEDTAALAAAISDLSGRQKIYLALFCAENKIPHLPFSYFDLFISLSRLRVFTLPLVCEDILPELAAWLDNPTSQIYDAITRPAKLPSFDIAQGKFSNLVHEPGFSRLLLACCREMPSLLGRIEEGQEEEKLAALRDILAAAICLGAPGLGRICQTFLAVLDAPLAAETELMMRQRLTAEVSDFLQDAAQVLEIPEQIKETAKKITEARWQQDLRRLNNLLLEHRPYESRRLALSLLKFCLPAMRRLGLELIREKTDGLSFPAAARVARCLLAAGSRVDIDPESLYRAAREKEERHAR